MGIGTPDGSYYDTQAEYALNQFKIDEIVAGAGAIGGASPIIQQMEDTAARSRGEQNAQVKDYDYEAWQAANPNAIMAPGQHYPDTYKLPNHPTFSNESMYHGKEGAEGGQWEKNQDGTWNFTPGKTNLEQHTPDELKDYFKRVEPGNTLILPEKHSEILEFPSQLKKPPAANDNKQNMELYRQQLRGSQPGLIPMRIPFDRV